MNTRGRRAVTRLLGSTALVVGLLITSIGLLTGSTPAKGYLLAGMLVVAGVGLRIEAALLEPRE